MDTLSAFAMGSASRNNRMRVFDWDKAAQLIKDNSPHKASAGLSEDWEWTGGTIYESGHHVNDDYTYLASTWATPEINIDGEIHECWKWMDETKWDAHTKWPPSSLKILGIELGN